MADLRPRHYHMLRAKIRNRRNSFGAIKVFGARSHNAGSAAVRDLITPCRSIDMPFMPGYLACGRLTSW